MEASEPGPVGKGIPRPDGAGSSTAVEATRIVVDAPLFDHGGLALVLAEIEFTRWSMSVRVDGLPDASTESMVQEYLSGLDRLTLLDLLDARHPATRLLAPLQMDVTDDTGTSYRSVGRAGAVGHAAWSREWHFSPGPPPGATRLIVRVYEDDGPERGVEVGLG